MMTRERTMRIERKKGGVKLEREAGQERKFSMNLKGQIYFKTGEK